MPAATVRPAPVTARSATLSPPRRPRMARVPLHPVRLSPPPLRTVGGHDREERRASWLELFFDLAFAGAVGQLAGALQDHPSLGHLARFLMLFTPIWWLWVQLSFYADRHESEDAAHRTAFLTAILLCVALAASAPRALSGDTTGFVIAFSLMRGLQLMLYARARHHLPATRALYTRYLIFFGAGGALWLCSLAAPGAARYAIWGAALLTDAVGALAMLAPSRRVPVNPCHLADRFQIFVLIVLGESVARLISAAADRPWSVPLAVVLAAALITLAAAWWAWLSTATTGMPSTPRRRSPGSPPSTCRSWAASEPPARACTSPSWPPTEAGPSAAGPRAALYGGVSVYLLASAILPSRKLTRRARAARLATSLAAMGLVFMGAIVVPVYLVPALAAVLALGLIAEAWPRINRRRAASVWNPHRFGGERHAALAARPGPGLATAGLRQGSES